MSEIIVLLEKARGWILLEGGLVCPHKFGICKHDNENCPVFCIDQALTLLKKQPTASEFRKKVEIRLPVCLPNSYEGMKSICATLTGLVIEACDRLDSTEAINKDLLELCEEFMEIADDGSAAFDDPVPGSIFLRAGVAIAKAKKVGK